MEYNLEANFENIIEKLSKRFDSNPYSLSPTDIQILKWFSQNPGYLGNQKMDKKHNLFKTSLFYTFIKANLQND